MIIVRSPMRISLLGGGTDYPAFYRGYPAGGAVLGFALNRYVWLSLRELPPFFEHRHRIAYSKVETVHAAAEVEHPVVRAVLLDREANGVTAGYEIHHDGDLPARSGLGSSAAFAVGLLHAMEVLSTGRNPTAAELARRAIRLEREVLGEATGDQDQHWSAFGNLNRIDFPQLGDGDAIVTPLALPEGREAALLDHLTLYYTGVQRSASEVAAAQLANFPSRLAELARLRAMVDEVQRLLLAMTSDHAGVLRALAALLDEAWSLKRGLAGAVSSDSIDLLYARARAAGAWGGKLLGAGGGGFLLLLAPPGRQAAVRAALAGLVEVRPGIDRGGSRVVFNGSR